VHTITAFITKLLLHDPVALTELLFDIFQRLPIIKSLPGIYEVLSYESKLEIKDSKGKIAVFSKRQKVRFLQNNIIAYQDKAWGDGEIFADYKCSPGQAVDRYRDGHRYNILISLRETKQRDEVETFLIERKIVDGFTQDTELFQTDIDHRTHHLILSLIFPKNRPPRRVTLVEQNSQKSTILGEKYRKELPDGREEYLWQTRKPRLFEAYILKWEW
jgi:hypothetical protein